MQSSKLIHLNERMHTGGTSTSGDFTITMNEDLTLYDGDQITIKNAFIDAIGGSSEDTVVIDPPGITVNVELGYYLQNAVQPPVTDKSASINSPTFLSPRTLEFVVDDVTTTNVQPDLNHYVLCSVLDPTATGDIAMELVTNYVAGMTDTPGLPDPPNITFTWVNHDGSEGKQKIDVIQYETDYYVPAGMVSPADLKKYVMIVSGGRTSLWAS